MSHSTCAVMRLCGRLLSYPLLALWLGGCGDGPTRPARCRSEIAFTAYRDSDNELFVMDPDASNVRQLATNRVAHPSWSGDGRKIAFARRHATALDSVAMIDADGTGEVPLPIAVGGAMQVALAPDAGRLAIVTANVGGFAITIATLDGTLAPLVTGVSDMQGPAWSPDGGTLAFAGYDESTRALQVWSASLDGSNARRLTSLPGRKRQTAWSPDGHRLAFVADSAIYVMGADGSGLRRIRSDTTVSSWSTLTWSPDGTRLAYGRWYVSPTYSYLSGIAVLQTDGSGHRYLVTDTVPYVNGLSWSPCLP